MGLIYLLLFGCASNCCSRGCGCDRNDGCGCGNGFDTASLRISGDGCGCGCNQPRSGGCNRCCKFVCECRCGYGRCAGNRRCNVCNDAEYYNRQYALNGCVNVSCNPCNGCNPCNN